jgi:hypothetical protein
MASFVGRREDRSRAARGPSIIQPDTPVYVWMKHSTATKFGHVVCKMGEFPAYIKRIFAIEATQLRHMKREIADLATYPNPLYYFEEEMQHLRESHDAFLPNNAACVAAPDHLFNPSIVHDGTGTCHCGPIGQTGWQSFRVTPLVSIAQFRECITWAADANSFEFPQSLTHIDHKPDILRDGRVLPEEDDDQFVRDLRSLLPSHIAYTCFPPQFDYCR